MGSMENDNIGSETAREDKEQKAKETGLEESKLSSNIQIKKSKSRKKFKLFPNFGCLRLNDDGHVVQNQDVESSLNLEPACDVKDHVPKKTHLIVMINGIIGSSQNWRYAAKQFMKVYPNDVLVHCSESNSSMLTFDGVDVMGKRLSEEVISVVEHNPKLRKISFVGHSLGGLVARYAIAVLYQKDFKPGEETDKCDGEESCVGKIAGLEPVNFITSATPHLGSRGHKQVPVFCGFHTMEKAAASASFLLGRTGKHLFLCDADDGKPPLLLQMSSDSEELKFISALQSFKRCVAYANARFDHLVGWSSSSLRRRHELPKRRNLVKHEKYPHIVSEVPSKDASREEVSSDNKVPGGRTSEMEEAMIKGLIRLDWERVDVNFRGTIQQLVAHNTIQVKTYCINYHGADVIQHMIDNFLL